MPTQIGSTDSASTPFRITTGMFVTGSIIRPRIFISTSIGFSCLLDARSDRYGVRSRNLDQVSRNWRFSHAPNFRYVGGFDVFSDQAVWGGLSNSDVGIHSRLEFGIGRRGEV